MKSIHEEQGAWVFLVPISNLVLTKAVNFEFKIERTTFVSTDKLPKRRKRFGIPNRISDLKDKNKIGLGDFLSSSACFATLRQTGKLVDWEETIFEIIREELAILALSQLGFVKRQYMSSPSISEEKPRSSRSYYATNAATGSGTWSNRLLGGVRPLHIDAAWKRSNQNSFFFDLLKIIRGEIKVAKHWQRDLRNAAILVGSSQISRDLPHAFLNNMIALELLLTEQGDSFTEALPARAEAFLGWIGYWKDESFEEKIREVYKKRCALVHSGRRDLITRNDLFFTDDLLLNLFVNIIGHYNLFSTKASIIEFSKKVQAEHLLGVKPKVRPKTLRFLHRTYSEKDYQT